MIERIKQFKILSLIMNLAYLALGIALTIVPIATKFYCILGFGAIIIGYGISNIINYFIYGYEPFGFINGIIQVIFGIIIMSCAELLATPQVFGIIFGIYFIVKGLLEMQDSADYRRAGVKLWWLHLIFATLIFICGIVTLFSPFSTERILLITLGAFIIVDSILNIISLFVVSNRMNRVKHSIKDFFKSEENIIDITPEDNN